MKSPRRIGLSSILLAAITAGAVLLTGCSGSSTTAPPPTSLPIVWTDTVWLGSYSADPDPTATQFGECEIWIGEELATITLWPDWNGPEWAAVFDTIVERTDEGMVVLNRASNSGLILWRDGPARCLFEFTSPEWYALGDVYIDHSRAGNLSGTLPQLPAGSCGVRPVDPVTSYR
jgi:hypothetical protein